jgi:hypothetical protein
LQHAAGPSDPESGNLRIDEMPQRGMRRNDALGLAGRAGGVDEIGGIIRPGRVGQIGVVLILQRGFNVAENDDLCGARGKSIEPRAGHQHARAAIGDETGEQRRRRPPS